MTSINWKLEDIIKDSIFKILRSRLRESSHSQDSTRIYKSVPHIWFWPHSVNKITTKKIHKEMKIVYISGFHMDATINLFREQILGEGV